MSPGCSTGETEMGDAPLGWGDPVDAGVARHFSGESIEQAPRWTAAESPRFVLVSEPVRQRSVDKAAVLPDGRVVLVYSVSRSDSTLLHFFDPASGEEARTIAPKGPDGETLAWGHSFVAIHDRDIILMVDNRPRARRGGADIWYADRIGDLTQPASYVGNNGALVGVFPDGSLVTMPHSRLADTTFVFSVVAVRPAPAGAEPSDSLAETLPFTVAAPADPAGFYTPPWGHLPDRASAVAGDTIWIVPTERPELLAVHRSGRVLLKVGWEAGDRSISPAADGIWAGAERFPAAVVLRIGTDGLIYVQRWAARNDVPYPGPEWLVFSPIGELVARLDIPLGWRVLAFGNRAVVVGVTSAETGLGEVRVYGLEPGPTAPLPAQAAQDRDARVSPCPRAEERTFPIGSVTRVAEEKPPCRIRFRETGIRLDAVADGSRPDPGRTVLVDSNGRFITANATGWDATISVWDSRGRYLSSFGREGEGPGELTQRGMLTMFIDGRDNLHVRDGAFAWSVFSPRHEFLRRVPANMMGGLPGTTVILDDGSALASDRRGDAGRFFRVVDSTGALQRSFGQVEAGSFWLGREIAHAGGETFWAAPPEEGAEAYILEEWGIDGELRRTLRREASWWRWRGNAEISPAVRQLHQVRGGLLYVMLRRPTDEYVKQFTSDGNRRIDQRELRERRDAGVEGVVEIIDTRSGELLASEVYSGAELREILPRHLFRGSLRGYRYRVGDDGLPFVEIVEVQLVPG